MDERKLTVVQVLPELDEGGVEGETVDLAIYLVQQGHNSVVISGGGRLVSQLERAGCTHIHWPHIGEKSVRCLQYIPLLRKYLLSHKIDIFHLRSRLPAWIGIAAWKLLPKELRPGLLTTFHGFYSVNSYSRIMTRGQYVAAVSETIRDHIITNYKIAPEKIRLIYGGFDRDEFCPEKISPARADDLRSKWIPDHIDQKVIILPGRLTQWKGHELFVDAFAALESKNIIGLLVGDTEENPSYTKRLRDKIANYGLQNNIRLVGHCSDMPAAFQLADLVVSASSSQPEAFGKVAIEAMAMEKPVIATAHGGSLETVLPGKTGWLVPPNDALSMSKTIREAISNPELLKEYGRTGRQWVNEQFTSEQMCRNTVNLYREIAESKSPKKSKDHITVMQLLPELNSGGVERGTLEMGRYLSSRGHTSIVVSGGGRLVPQLTREGSIHKEKRIGAKSPIILFYIWPLRQMLKNLNVDILHMRSRMPAWVGYIAWLSLPPKKRPALVTTFHGFYSVNQYSAIMAKGEGVIAVSESIRRHIQEKYDRTHKVRLIFRGVDSNAFDPAKVDSTRLDELVTRWKIPKDMNGRRIVLLPGRISRLKGQEVFLKSILRMKCDNFLALLVGDTSENPNYTDELVTFIRDHNLQSKVELVGYCSDMPAAFMLADVVLSASSIEPEAFGRTTVEAMAMGKPVIATAHGGSLETVVEGENGWLVIPSDPDHMARVVDTALLTDRAELVRLGENGRLRVKANFTAETMCRQTTEFYRELLANNADSKVTTLN